MDKQTCRRPRGHRKHDGVDVGGAVKREIHVHPPARFSIVRSVAFAGIAMEIDLPGRKLSEAAPVMKIRQAFPRRIRAIHSIPPRSCVRACVPTYVCVVLIRIAVSNWKRSRARSSVKGEVYARHRTALQQIRLTQDAFSENERIGAIQYQRKCNPQTVHWLHCLSSGRDASRAVLMVL